jgi:hypothetical protein
MIKMEPVISFRLGNNQRWQKYYIESSSMCCSRCSGGTSTSVLTFKQEFSSYIQRNDGDPLHSFFPTHGCGGRGDSFLPRRLASTWWTVCSCRLGYYIWCKMVAAASYLQFSVGDPDPHVFGPPGSGSISQRYGSGFGSFPFLIKVLSELKDCLRNKISSRNFSKKFKFLILKIMCLRDG